MLAPHIKKKVDKLWDRFWAAGLTNPLVAVEQITYLIFLKRLEDIDKKRADAAQSSQQPYVSIYEPRLNDPAGIYPSKCRWSYIQRESNDIKNLSDNVFPWLRGIESRLAQQNADDELATLNHRMADAYFQLDPNKGQVLADAISLIDELFARAGDGSAAQDIMGDTFEYLLDEVATAGKNGQFRTPRHLIRFMVELLDPEPGQRVIDPAAGTGGFLFSIQQYLMRKFSTPENLVLEWDGTPHRLDGAKASQEQYAAIHHGANFVGLDNDRTMARIGWMNLILHDVTDPHLLQGDSLSKRGGKPKLAELLASESYAFVLANPPFTGTVDSNDLEKDSLLFPRAADKGKKKDDAITNKSELLFLWLMLDLLDVGGRCAVIIPEGVLFGNTDAHVRLRRELLTEHVVQAVISLPGGMFQPYTGVKTSVLIFRKETRRNAKQTFTGQTPRTEFVWFYEVEEDGFSRDAKRSPRPGQRNDLWDALVKFKAWQGQGRDGSKRLEKTYFQPQFHPERWRQALLRDSADQLTPAGEAFSNLTDTGMWDGQIWGNHELFHELPTDPKAADEKIRADASGRLSALVRQAYGTAIEVLANKLRPVIGQYDDESLLKEWRKVTKPIETELNRQIRDVQRYFEKEDSPALPLWKELTKATLAGVPEENYIKTALRYSSLTQETSTLDEFNSSDDSKLPLPAGEGWGEGDQYEKASTSSLTSEIQSIAREVAKLDGFDVVLRSPATDQQTPLDTAKHWVIPVREWLRNDEWQSEDGGLQASHDGNGLVRPQYVESMLAAGLYAEEKGLWTLKDGLLDPDCIEARDWNLSAGQYKPFDFTQLKSDKSVAELIGELKLTQQQIISGLDKLLMMVEGRK